MEAQQRTTPLLQTASSTNTSNRPVDDTVQCTPSTITPTPVRRTAPVISQHEANHAVAATRSGGLEKLQVSANGDMKASSVADMKLSSGGTETTPGSQESPKLTTSRANDPEAERIVRDFFFKKRQELRDHLSTRLQSVPARETSLHNLMLKILLTEGVVIKLQPSSNGGKVLELFSSNGQASQRGSGPFTIIS